jgi:hypothetical protein
MEARYTYHDIAPDRAARVHQAWEKIQRALRDLGKIK